MERNAPTNDDSHLQTPFEKHQQHLKTESDMYRHFERYHLELVIKDINVDFVDEEEIKSEQASMIVFTAGVSVIAKLVYDSYNSHEQLGYGTASGDSRGKAILDAKRKAIEDASIRCSKMFGDIHSGHAQLMQQQKQAATTQHR
ncbi:hypothetical protein C9374_009132 [Naegleria lovaniensis]|uniref:Uncharacterized protein n=1 Tax=Naegleria lovaniensis TaxID=51637 RepID=A0AA88GJH3_NAELO|nr:uncharacterized protein C9374_009132 [Naegleria lovaniensis]KAG2377616.1 hypothetical protein C9374_009132 [Naegleria lovaniensis]